MAGTENGCDDHEFAAKKQASFKYYEEGNFIDSDWTVENPILLTSQFRSVVSNYFYRMLRELHRRNRRCHTYLQGRSQGAQPLNVNEEALGCTSFFRFSRGKRRLFRCKDCYLDTKFLLII